MAREVCIRCGGAMDNIGQEKLQLGQYSVLLGHLGQLFSGALTVDIYCCRDCRKLEFYAVEEALRYLLPVKEPSEDEDSIAQVPCPHCGQFHELDDPKCPHCGKRLLE